MRSVAVALRDDLMQIVEAVGGGTVRPTSLVRQIGIDQNLASRLLRATRACKPLEILHAIPAPKGLRIFLEAARKAEVDPDLCQKAAASIERFQLLTDEFPAGRAGLNAAISSSVPEMRAQAERTAKQSAFKAMSYLLGLQSDAIVGATVRQPSSDGRTCDQMFLDGKHGVRRTRLGRAINIFGMRHFDADIPADVDPLIRTLDGDVAPKDLKTLLLRPFCSDPLPHLKVISNDDSLILTLPDNTLDVNVPTTLVVAFVHSGAMRYRTDSRAEEWLCQSLRCPCRIYVQDLFLHEEIDVGSAPKVSVRLPGSVAPNPTAPSSAPTGDSDELDLSISVELLGMGLRNIYCKEVPSHSEAIEYAFKRVGWDPNRFHVYRYHMIYPVPLVSFTWWFPLADPP